MSEILDGNDKEEFRPELSKNFRDLLIILAILTFIIGGAWLWLGIETEISIREMRELPFSFTIFRDPQVLFMLFLAPITMIAGAVLLLAKKRIGWIISMASFIFITAVLIVVFYINASNAPIWMLFITLLPSGITFVLASPAYRKHFIFKMDDIFFIVGIPSILMFIIIFAK